MDTMQILLLIVLSITTIFLMVVGVQIVLLLNELKKTLATVNKIVKGFDTIGMGLQHGLGEATGFINGLKTIMKIVDIYNNRRKNDNA